MAEIGSNSIGSDSYRPVPGDIEIGSAVLVNYNKSEKWDLRHIALEFSLYESIGSDHLRADIIIADSLALTTRMPIVGEEVIQLKFRTPNASSQVDNKWIEATLVVVRMDHLQPTNVRTGHYKLTAISQVGMANLPQMVAKSFGPAKISDMAKQIADQYLGVKGQKIIVEPTQGLHKFAIPYKSPLQALHFLAREAQVEAGKVSDYVVYEDHERLNFRTVQSMLVQPPAATYYVTEHSLPQLPGASSSGVIQTSAETGGDSGNINPKEWRYITNLTFVQNFDVEKAIANGMYDNTVWVVDPIMQKFIPINLDGQRSHFLYDKHFGLFKQSYQRSPNKLHSASAPMAKFAGLSHVRFLVTNKFQDEQKLRINHRKRHDHLPLTVSAFQQADFIVAELTIPGDSNRKAGDIIHFDLHEFGATDDVIGEINKYISGGFLIYSIRNKVTFNGYYSTHIECIKTCYENKIERAPATQGSSEIIPTTPTITGV